MNEFVIRKLYLFVVVEFTREAVMKFYHLSLLEFDAKVFTAILSIQIFSDLTEYR